MVLNDGLYDESGAIVIIIEPGADASTARQQFRSELYIVAALGVIKFFGYSEAQGRYSRNKYHKTTVPRS